MSAPAAGRGAVEHRPLRIGNDVVDLDAPRMRGKAGHGRFLDRILHASERRVVERAGDADVELWCHWAAKEAAYKVVSKLEGAPPPFVHARFVVAWNPVQPDEPLGPLRRGVVGYRAVSVPVEVEVRPEVLHAVAWAEIDAGTPRAPSPGPLAGPEPQGRRGAGPTAGPPPSPTSTALVRLDSAAAPWNLPDDELLSALTDRERGPVHSRASAAVRLGAKAELSDRLEVEQGRIEIICGEGPKGRRPPEVLLDGVHADVDVSLSHHGIWIGWAIHGPAPASARG